jgi:Putative glycosyl/glycerophosphate transferases involved in teichoic acid biosynthesis TagF/TagB/EpsJ/RodC
MPVYNVERYLPACLESVVKQTMPDVEIIAVNDGSKDKSLSILEDYQRRYSDRMKVFTTENCGVSHARNFGLTKASGEYILFVDSDDFIERDMCEKLYRKAAKDGNDIVICGRYNVYEREHIGQQNKEITGTLLINRNFKLVENKYELAHISPFPWDKLFKRSILSGLEFPEKMRFEDLVLVYEACTRAESIGVVEEPLYNYRRTTQGGFLNSFSEQTLDIVKAFELVFDFMKKNGYMETYHDELEYICTRHFLFRYPALFHEGNKGKLGIKLEIIRKTQEFLDRELPDWRKNHYLKYSSGALKEKIKLYTNKNKMLRMTRIREATPEFAAKIILRMRNLKRKLMKKYQRFKRSPNKMALIKKKLPLLAVLKQGGSVYYTKMYEKLPVAAKDILLESKHGEDLAGNIFAILCELSKASYKEFRVLLAMEKNYMPQFGPLLEKYQVKNVTMVEFRSKAYMRALASAKYLVTDTSFPPYFIKKKEQVYLNTWHGTPLKAMGRIVPQREYALGNVQRNFAIADYLLYQNEFSRDIFLEDYMLKDIYPGTVLLSGYPRNSVFFNKNRYLQIRQECKLTDKQVIVYMPTWRGLLHQKDTAKQLEQLVSYFKAIDKGLTDRQVFYVKLHPFVKNQLDYSGYRHIKDFPSQYETYDFLNASDVLVTDYSSIMFDYGVTKRKIILFTYDRIEYLTGRGLYIDLNALEFPKADTVDDLMKELNAGTAESSLVDEERKEYYPEFYKKFCSYDSADTTAQVCETLLYGKTKASADFISQKVVPDGRKKVLIYIKGMKRDDYTKRLLHSIHTVDINKYDVYVCVKSDNVKNATQMLSELKKEIKYIPITYDVNYTRMDYILCKLKLKLGFSIRLTNKRLDKVMKREIRKYFGEMEFDYVIHQSELDAMIGRMCCLLAKSASIYNFKYFDFSKYKKESDYRKLVKYFCSLFPKFTKVVATKEFNLLHKKADNIIYNEETVFPIPKILEEVTQDESRRNNLS